MSLLRLTAVARFFGAERLFGPITVAMAAGDKVGLIGRNGAGKTTLMRLIAAVDAPDEGERILARSATVGYMSQGVEVAYQGTLWQYVEQAQVEVRQLGERMAQLETAMADPSVHADSEQLESVLAEYALVRGRFEQAGGYSMDAAIRATLFGLGFSAGDFALPFAALSGGQKVRAALARLLLTSPDLLLLDEPTNHLDVKAVEWLEEYLRNYKGAMILISHDRAFLDAVVNHIWELELGELHVYNGNYTAARAQRAERRARAEKEYLAQQREIAKLESYIRRYKEGNRATMAKSREKALARLTPAERPAADDDAMRLRLSAGVRSGKEVVVLDDVAKRFGDRTVLSGVNLLVCRGDRIGIVGPNGAGKSTLLKLMAGVLPPSQGQVRYGKDVACGYFSQELANLDPENTVIDELLDTRHMTLYEARSHLAKFMFTGDDVFKPVGVLSGGERNRLTLAKLVLMEANLLLLDEPTNHLDIPGREALEDALQAYGGTLVFVSHDRYFLSSLARRVWVVADGNVEDFAGTYDEYKARAAEERQAPPAAEPEETKSGSWQTLREAKMQRRAAERTQRRLAARLSEVEQAIAAAEAEKARLEAALADSDLYADGEKARSVTQAHRAVLAQLEELYEQWTELAEECECSEA